ncbi:MAG TPA: TfuA-like protein [Acidimicrobiales bacterium]|nr:TfuA-like protein [Acidimicrobiales bacterium]
MRVAVFCGPTIGAPAVTGALRGLDVDVRPPAAQGDVLRALAGRPDVLVIVDGYFDRQPSVWHKEILVAMEGGAHVFGGASMGALRAAELDHFGMVGVGRVYEDFRDGVLVDDDEVAVAHGPAESGFAPLSTAMVDLRDRVEQAVAAGAVGPSTGATLVAAAKALPYPLRSVPAAVAGAGGAPPAELAAFAAFAAGAGRKERDARRLLAEVAAFAAADPEPLVVDWAVERTVFLDQLVAEVETAAAGAGPAAGDRDVLVQLLAEREAERLGIRPSPEEVDEEVARLRRAYGLLAAGDTVERLRAAGADWPDLVAWARRSALVDKVAWAHRFTVAAALPGHLRVRAALEGN